MAQDGEPVPLSKDDYVQLRSLLWPQSLSPEQLAIIQRPWLQGLEFYDQYPFQSFFVQHQNGPCGLIASVQALLIQELLHPSLPPRDRRVDSRDPLAVTPSERRQALVRAIAMSLWRAGGTAKAVVIVPEDLRAFETTLTALLARSPAPLSNTEGSNFHPFVPAPAAAAAAVPAAAAAAVAVAGHLQPQSWSTAPADELFFTSSMVMRTCVALDVTMALIDRHISLFCGKGGLVVLLLSLVASRGVEAVRTDFGSDIAAMVGEDSCGEQALVNLCLAGRACNEVDSDRWRGGWVAPAGFLTVEQQYTPAPLFVSPPAAVWVLHGGGHYTVLWSPELQRTILDPINSHRDPKKRVLPSFPPFSTVPRNVSNATNASSDSPVVLAPLGAAAAGSRLLNRRTKGRNGSGTARAGMGMGGAWAVRGKKRRQAVQISGPRPASAGPSTTGPSTTGPAELTDDADADLTRALALSLQAAGLPHEDVSVPRAKAPRAEGPASTRGSGLDESLVSAAMNALAAEDQLTDDEMLARAIALSLEHEAQTHSTAASNTTVTDARVVAASAGGEGEGEGTGAPAPSPATAMDKSVFQPIADARMTGTGEETQGNDRDDPPSNAETPKAAPTVPPAPPLPAGASAATIVLPSIVFWHYNGLHPPGCGNRPVRVTSFLAHLGGNSASEGEGAAAADAEEENKARKIKVVLDRRVRAGAEDEYLVVCEKDGSMEGVSAPPAGRWRCRDCYLQTPPVWNAYNDEASDVCCACNQPIAVCGFCHVLPRSQIPSALLAAWDRAHAPPIVQALRRAWAKADIELHEATPPSLWG
eukprot:m.24419 g.24419  ORF g.24419 m.24419 type:complete len:815 (+) comp8687_c0_seq1:117-2561(+)